MERVATAVVATILGAACLIGPAAAGEAEGRAIAERWCAACHVISPEQRQGTEGVPSFAEIASTRDDTAIARFLFDPHPTMAGLSLSRGEIDSVKAYIRAQAP